MGLLVTEPTTGTKRRDLCRRACTDLCVRLLANLVASCKWSSRVKPMQTVTGNSCPQKHVLWLEIIPPPMRTEKTGQLFFHPHEERSTKSRSGTNLAERASRQPQDVR
jgi:hypothetical protein